jgi:PIN domain nuclease of toxin-antitoxin system
VKLLLDTHIWIWSLVDPKRLAPRVERAIRSTKNELWLSPISVWETLMLIEAKRVRVKGDARSWVERALSEVPLREAPLTYAIALESRRIGLSHQDPADRFLAATASIQDLTLVTADERLAAGRGYRTLVD